MRVGLGFQVLVRTSFMAQLPPLRMTGANHAMAHAKDQIRRPWAHQALWSLTDCQSATKRARGGASSGGSIQRLFTTRFGSSDPDYHTVQETRRDGRDVGQIFPGEFRRGAIPRLFGTAIAAEFLGRVVKQCLPLDLLTLNLIYHTFSTTGTLTRNRWTGRQLVRN